MRLVKIISFNTVTPFLQKDKISYLIQQQMFTILNPNASF